MILKKHLKHGEHGEHRVKSENYKPMNGFYDSPERVTAFSFQLLISPCTLCLRVIEVSFFG